MQKKLIVLAIAAMASTSAFADVTVYGKLDAGYSNTSKTTFDGNGSSTISGQDAITYSNLSSSRLGVNVTQDVADGIKAAVKVETGIGSNAMAAVSQTAGTGTTAPSYATGAGSNIDATSLGNRELNASLILAGGTTIKAGYGSTLVRDFVFAYDAASGSFGGNLVGNLLANDATISSNRKVSVDAIQQFGPLKAVVSVSHNADYNNATASTTKGNGYLIGGQYVDGPLSVGAVYQVFDAYTPGTAAVAYKAPTTGNGTTTISTLGTLAVAAVPATDVQTKITEVGANYDLGVAKLFAQYAKVDTADSQDTSTLGAATTGTGTRSYESIGIEVPVGAAMIFAQASKGSVNQVFTANVAASSRDTSGMTVGALYSLSKTVTAYAAYGATKLSADTSTTAMAAKFTGVNDTQTTAGLVYAF